MSGGALGWNPPPKKKDKTAHFLTILITQLPTNTLKTSAENNSGHTGDFLSISLKILGYHPRNNYSILFLIQNKV